MALVLCTILLILEIGTTVFSLTKPSPKRDWTRFRLLVCGAELAVFLLMLLLPGIDLSFRFTALAAVLILRIVTAAIGALVCRSNDVPKKKPLIVLGMLGSIVLLTLSLVPAFLFRDYHGLPLTGGHAVAQTQAILTDPDRLESFETDGSHREIPVHLYYPEDAAALEAGSLPLVIFSHGAFGYYQSNTSTYMELASHGYVVASLDHPYHAFFTKDTDGRTVTVDPTFLQSALTIGSGDAKEEAVFDTTSQWMALRTADMTFVLDTLEDAAQSGTLSADWSYADADEAALLAALRLVDTEKIGLMGHSLGGATAVTVGRREDVSAVIDIDGTMLGEETGVADGALLFNEAPYDTPLLAIDNETHHQDAAAARQAGELYANNVVLDHAADGYETYFRGAGHMDLTDLPLLSPALASMLGKGTVDTEACMTQMNALVVQFFDCYLKDSGTFTVAESY